MLKNIVIVLLIVVTAYLILSGRNSPDNKEDKDAVTTTSPTIVSEDNEDTRDADESEDRVPQGETLDLSGQGLTKLPSYVLDRKSLEILNISDNNLSGALPAEIRHLTNLKVLNASNNKMTGVPAEIGQLGKLEILDLSDNQLTGLPYEMGNLKSLKILNLSGNNYSAQDLERIKKDLPSGVEIIL